MYDFFYNIYTHKYINKMDYLQTVCFLIVQSDKFSKMSFDSIIKNCCEQLPNFFL